MDMATITDRKDEAMHTIHLDLSQILMLRDGLSIASAAPGAALDMPAKKAKGRIADAYIALTASAYGSRVTLTDDEIMTIHRATTYAMGQTGEKEYAKAAFAMLAQTEGIGA